MTLYWIPWHLMGGVGGYGVGALGVMVDVTVFLFGRLSLARNWG
jgi:hypothetical protein